MNKMNTKKISGFTLIELLISAVIIGVLSIVTTQLLFNALTTKSKQNTLTLSSDTGYVVVEQISRNLKNAQGIEITAGNQIAITNQSVCINYRYNSSNLTIEKATDSNPPCNPSVYFEITPQDFKVKNLYFSPEGTSAENVSLLIEADVKDSQGVHPVKYQTSLKTRISL